MLVHDHLAKAERYERSLSKLTSQEDSPAATWGAMHAGTQYLNAILHACGVTEANPGCPTMYRGVYMWRYDSGELVRRQLASGDVIHSDQWLESDPEDFPPDARVALEVLAQIERAAGVATRSTERLLTTALDEVDQGLSVLRELAIKGSE